MAYHVRGLCEADNTALGVAIQRLLHRSDLAEAKAQLRRCLDARAADAGRHDRTDLGHGAAMALVESLLVLVHNEALRGNRDFTIEYTENADPRSQFRAFFINFAGMISGVITPQGFYNPYTNTMTEILNPVSFFPWPRWAAGDAEVKATARGRVAALGGRNARDVAQMLQERFETTLRPPASAHVDRTNPDHYPALARAAVPPGAEPPPAPVAAPAAAGAGPAPAPGAVSHPPGGAPARSFSGVVGAVVRPAGSAPGAKGAPPPTSSVKLPPGAREVTGNTRGVLSNAARFGATFRPAARPPGGTSGKKGGRSKTRRRGAGKKTKTRRNLRGGQDKFSPLAKSLMTSRTLEKGITPEMRENAKYANKKIAGLTALAEGARSPQVKAGILNVREQLVQKLYPEARESVAVADKAKSRLAREFNAVGGTRRRQGVRKSRRNKW